MHRSIVIDLNRTNLLIHSDTALHGYTSLVNLQSYSYSKLQAWQLLISGEFANQDLKPQLYYN